MRKAENPCSSHGSPVILPNGEAVAGPLKRQRATTIEVALWSFWAALALAGCHPEPVREPRPRQTGPGLMAPIVLPNGDGRVYIIEMHDELGIETQKCLVHVSDSGSSTACPPSQFGPTP